MGRIIWTPGREETAEQEEENRLWNAGMPLAAALGKIKTREQNTYARVLL